MVCLTVCPGRREGAEESPAGVPGTGSSSRWHKSSAVQFVALCVGTPSSKGCGHGTDVDAEAGGTEQFQGLHRWQTVLTELSPPSA